MSSDNNGKGIPIPSMHKTYESVKKGNAFRMEGKKKRVPEIENPFKTLNFIDLIYEKRLDPV